MDFVEMIRKDMEQRLKAMNDPALRYDPWMNPGMSYDQVQVYLLLQILDRLTSIDDSLTTMSSDSWDEHHGK